MTAFLTHMIAFLVGIVAGWFIKGSWATAIKDIEDAAKK